MLKLPVPVCTVITSLTTPITRGKKNKAISTMEAAFHCSVFCYRKDKQSSTCTRRASQTKDAERSVKGEN